MKASGKQRLLLLAAAAIVFAVALPFLPGWVERERIQELIAGAGIWGPVLIIVLMTAAIVFSPVPSAPIALAAGAAYGHTQGTIYIVIGAEAGALIAFVLARYLGRDIIQRWFGEKLAGFKFLGSQNLLMWLVFVSRLMPFVSFDLMSYAAGLSNLVFWRFAVATLAGIIPASFLLAHLGGQVMQEGSSAATWLVFGIGVITGAPIIWTMLKSRNAPKISNLKTKG